MRESLEQLSYPLDWDDSVVVHFIFLHVEIGETDNRQITWVSDLESMSVNGYFY